MALGAVLIWVSPIAFNTLAVGVDLPTFLPSFLSSLVVYLPHPPHSPDPLAH